MASTPVQIHVYGFHALRPFRTATINIVDEHGSLVLGTHVDGTDSTPGAYCEAPRDDESDAPPSVTHTLSADYDLILELTVDGGDTHGALVSAPHVSTILNRKIVPRLVNTVLGAVAVAFVVANNDREGYVARLTSLLQMVEPSSLESIPDIVEAMAEPEAFSYAWHEFGSAAFAPLDERAHALQRQYEGLNVDDGFLDELAATDAEHRLRFFVEGLQLRFAVLEPEDLLPQQRVTAMTAKYELEEASVLAELEEAEDPEDFLNDLRDAFGLEPRLSDPVFARTAQPIIPPSLNKREQQEAEAEERQEAEVPKDSAQERGQDGTAAEDRPQEDVDPAATNATHEEEAAGSGADGEWVEVSQPDAPVEAQQPAAVEVNEPAEAASSRPISHDVDAQALAQLREQLEAAENPSDRLELAQAITRLRYPDQQTAVGDPHAAAEPEEATSDPPPTADASAVDIGNAAGAKDAEQPATANITVVDGSSGEARSAASLPPPPPPPDCPPPVEVGPNQLLAYQLVPPQPPKEPVAPSVALEEHTKLKEALLQMGRDRDSAEKTVCDVREELRDLRETHETTVARLEDMVATKEAAIEGYRERNDRLVANAETDAETMEQLNARLQESKMSIDQLSKATARVRAALASDDASIAKLRLPVVLGTYHMVIPAQTNVAIGDVRTAALKRAVRLGVLAQATADTVNFQLFEGEAVLFDDDTLEEIGIDATPATPFILKEVQAMVVEPNVAAPVLPATTPESGHGLIPAAAGRGAVAAPPTGAAFAPSLAAAHGGGGGAGTSDVFIAAPREVIVYLDEERAAELLSHESLERRLVNERQRIEFDNFHHEFRRGFDVVLKRIVDKARIKLVDRAAYSRTEEERSHARSALARLDSAARSGLTPDAMLGVARHAELTIAAMTQTASLNEHDRRARMQANGPIRDQDVTVTNDFAAKVEKRRAQAVSDLKDMIDTLSHRVPVPPSRLGEAEGLVSKARSYVTLASSLSVEELQGCLRELITFVNSCRR